MLIEDMKVGEVYCLGGKRAKLDSIGVDDEGFPLIKMLRGRSLDEEYICRQGKYSQGRVHEIEETWQGSKDRKLAARNARAQAFDVQKQLAPAMAKLGIDSCWVNDTGMQIYADIDAIAALSRIIIEAAEESSKPGALGALLA